MRNYDAFLIRPFPVLPGSEPGVYRAAGQPRGATGQMHGRDKAPALPDEPDLGQCKEV